MRIINIIGSKGGVGTSTVAATVAIALAQAGERVVLVELNGRGDLRAIVGSVVERLTIADAIPDTDTAVADVAVVDHATSKAALDQGVHVLVLTNCYLSVLQATKLDLRIDGVVALMDPRRSLTVRDISNVLGISQARILHLVGDPEVARSVDAGMLAVRFPASLRRAKADRFVTGLTVNSARS